MNLAKLFYIEETKVKIETLKKGEYFRRVNGKAVYKLVGYDRSEKKYEAYKVDDVNSNTYFKKGTTVEVGFTY
jgi:hypothetical protein